MLSVQNNKSKDCDFSISIYTRRGFLYIAIEPEDEKASDRQVLKFSPSEARDFIRLIGEQVAAMSSAQ